MREADVPPERFPRVNVLGVRISAIDIVAALSEIERRVEEKDPGYLTFTGVHGVMESQRSPELLAIHNAAALTCPDGMPMVWGARFAGADGCARVYGPDVLLASCARSAERGWRNFFYGGGPGVADQLAASLADRFEDLNVVGTHSPPYRELTAAEEDHVVSMINASRADLVWVGLGTPKQERWMAAFRTRLRAPVLLGVGAAFDIHSGHLAQAPPWMRRSGLEWAFRLSCEPKRLWRRYLANNPRFLIRILCERPRLDELAT